ncbi:penicillin-binding transpeptidase domain-containing protein [Peptoniphilus equinus]|uniref:Penicillin-binding transpeptidase domain-containing protein n=1 Tax=Peptoniphilus equinus TaxID=3016343 RepID=A0ABY7QR21_9FIRM|nr:penicillin-binding transpeptidase domain-containing protein [Peptoniphilus equinus]WBW49235.1 penicillin-binding transpeptidase domain-containing protein [Peptoniphilus equinus]
MMNSKENKRLIVLLLGLIAMFLGLILYLSYFTVFEAKTIVDHPANRRDSIKVAGIKRGAILDSKGNVLAETVGEKYNYTRHYTYPRAYSHVIGYASKTKGRSGLEATYNDALLGLNSGKTLKDLQAFFDSDIDTEVGDNMTLTTNSNIQEFVRETLIETDKKGAIVVMNPTTGAILAMASSPDFNAQNIDQDYNAIVEQNNGAFFNNAIQGGYAPGSVFKIVTAAAILESDVDQSYEDTGEEVILGRAIKNAGGEKYGDIDLNEAFTYSVNTYFANKAVAIGKDKFTEVAERFMMNKDIDFDLNLATSTFKSEGWDQHALGSAAIGQADILTTPLQMTLITNAIANQGKIMAPYLVERITSPEGATIQTHEPTVLSEAITPENAQKLAEMMENVVRQGSGRGAQIRRTAVAGKTGTAQTRQADGSYNAWFVGFAPVKDPKVSVAVILQDSEKFGGEVAAPIAADIMEFALGELN